MKILFINSPLRGSKSYIDVFFGKLNKFDTSMYQPLGLCYISSMLKSHGFNDTRLIGSCFAPLEYDKILYEVKKFAPNIIGISCTSFSFYYALNLAKKIKQQWPNIFIVVGGIHLDFYAREVMSHECFDVGVIGDGVYTFLELVRLFQEAGIKRIKNELKSIQGIAYRYDSEVIVNGKGKIIEDFDSVPFPDRDLFMPEIYTKATKLMPNFLKPRLSILMSVGCPYSCSYCSKSFRTKIYRTRTPESVVEELKFCIKRYNLHRFIFIDEIFTFDKEKIHSLCSLIRKNKLKIDFAFQTRIDKIDKELLKDLNSVNGRWISFGVESGNQAILDKMGRGYNINQIIDSFTLCKRYEFYTEASFMLGHPDESLDSIYDAMRLLDKIEPEVMEVLPLILYPGTKLYEEYMVQNNTDDFWRHSTLSGKPTVLPEVCKKINRNELEYWCIQIKKEFYLRSFQSLKRLIFLVKRPLILSVYLYHFILFLIFSFCWKLNRQSSNKIIFQKDKISDFKGGVA